MKWYGKFNYFNIKKKSNKNRNIRLNKLFKKSSFRVDNQFSLKYFKDSLCLSSEWNFLIFQQNYSNLISLYVYNSEYFFIVPFVKKFISIRFDDSVNILNLNFFLKNNFYSLFWNYFKIIFSSFSKIFFKKLKFKGKGYYIYKNFRNTIALQFGYSHMYYIYSFFVTVKFITKTTILMFGNNYNDVLNKGYSLFNIKKINIFTGKGIRFSRQVIYKKTGKVSSYR